MVSKSLLYPFKHGSYHRKTVSLKNAVFVMCPFYCYKVWKDHGKLYSIIFR